MLALGETYIGGNTPGAQGMLIVSQARPSLSETIQPGPSVPKQGEL